MKRIVVCCDGTWNKPDQPSPTNVVKVAITLKQTDAAGTEQLLFYDAGVGTGTFDHLRGGAFGVGLSQNIRQAYHFLVFNYQPGDELYLFGFSRGAYTVRSTAGLIRNSGLLKRQYLGKAEEAYQLYRRRDKDSEPAKKEATEFRENYSYQPRLKFIGVWDTVGALGVPLRFANAFWKFHDVRLSRSVDYAYHALAIDERRKPFRPTLWEQHPEAPPSQVLEQVWFTGVHSNVGGGYPETNLSDIALLWMVGKAEACGLAFHREYLDQLVGRGNLDLKTLVKQKALGKLENSLKFFYKVFFLGGRMRPMGKGERAKESAASTAVDRLKDTSTMYEAKNLFEFLQAGGKQMPMP